MMGFFYCEIHMKCPRVIAFTLLTFHHLNHSIKDDGFRKVVIASADTDVFICAIYHYNRWVYRGRKEMWIISGKSGSLTAFLIHQLTEKLEHGVVNILPAVHALTDTFYLNNKQSRVFWLKVYTSMSLNIFLLDFSLQFTYLKFL